MARWTAQSIGRLAATPFWNHRERRLRLLWRLALAGALWSIAFLALVALVAASGIGWLIWPGTLLITLVVLVLASLVLDRRPLTTYGLRIDRAWWADLGFGLALGAMLMALIFGVQLVAGWITIVDVWHAPDAQAFLPSLAEPLLVFLSVGIYEELLVRGYLLRNLGESLPPQRYARFRVWLALIASSALFGAAHFANPGATIVSTVGIALAGVMLGLGYAYTGRLGIPIGVHITWNLFQGNVFGFPVSGAVFSEASLFAIRQNGPEVWTGGAFGPEAGLLSMLSLLLGIALIWLWARRRYGTASILRMLTEQTETAHT
jgi:uncharacterized protein